MTAPRRVAGKRAQSSGAAFELWCIIAHRACCEQGIAHVRRVSPHVKRLGPGRRPGSFEGVFSEPSGADFRGTLRGGRGLVIESKASASGALAWSEFTPEERTDLEVAAQLGGLALVLWHRCDLGATWAIPWGAMPWRAVGGGRSVRADDVELWRVTEPAYLRRFVEGA